MNPGERLYTGCVNSAAAKTSQVLCHPLTLQRETDKQAKITPFRKYKCQSWPCCPVLHNVCVLKNSAPEVTSLFVWINRRSCLTYLKLCIRTWICQQIFTLYVFWNCHAKFTTSSKHIAPLNLNSYIQLSRVKVPLIILSLFKSEKICSD